jgi:conjugative relaxase-like TrwC/TraI family protein
MVNISKALNSEKVQAYHKTDYANSEQKSYYSQAGEVPGQWHGQLAREMGLTGAVSSEHFKRLAEGQDPHTGEQLVRHRFGSEDAAAHRAGWDATFSAPKSVSVTALVGGDDRILEAHRQAVQKGLDYLERSAHAHLGGNHSAEHTGKWVAATFEHDTSRPVNGYSAPQLHTHAVFFNISKTPDGSAHALQERHIFAAQKTATAIYQAELGYRLKQLGYDLEEGKGGAREIKGYSEDYLKANSSRSEQIEVLAKKLQEQGLNKAEARQRAAHSTREAKRHQAPERTRNQQHDLARQHGNQHEPTMARARAAELRNRQEMTAEHALKAASQAVTFSREKSFEREAVASEHDLLREALRRGQDAATPAHIQAAFEAQRDRGQLIPIQQQGRQPAFTTPEMVAMEQQNITLMKAGQNQHGAFIAPSADLVHRIDRHFEQFQTDAAKQNDDARRAQLEAAIHNQKEAIQQVLTCRDQVQAFQGAAGTGKTTSLTVVRKELEQQGYAVKGFAPTSRAAQQLGECGAECSTLQKFLATPPEQIDQSVKRQPHVYFVDETSLASAKQVNELLSRLSAQDRLVLIGDVRQHESVDAGRAFAQLQEHGIRTARLDEIVRQKDQSLLQAVEHLAAGRVPEAVTLLNDQGRVKEISDEGDRFRAISREYLQNPKGTLIVSPDNRSRASINGILHEELKRTGAVQDQDHSVPVLVPRQEFTGADRKWAKSYEQGGILRFNHSSGNFKEGDRATVIEVDTSKNLVTVQKTDGKTVTYDPSRCHGASLYRQETRQLAVGDRIQFTAPYKERKVANRELATVKEIKGKEFTVALDSGKTLKFDVTQHPHIDHGYAVTSHSSQGLTTDKVLINIDTDRTNPQLINNRLAYVAVSRARHDARIYTNDATGLGQALSSDVSKSSAITLQRSPATTNVQQQGTRPSPPAKNQSQQQGLRPNSPAQSHTQQQAAPPSAPAKSQTQHQNTPPEHAQQQGGRLSPANGQTQQIQQNSAQPTHDQQQTVRPAAPSHRQASPNHTTTIVHSDTPSKGLAPAVTTPSALPAIHDPTNPTQIPAARGQAQGQGLGIEQSKAKAQQLEYAEEEGFGF